MNFLKNISFGSIIFVLLFLINSFYSLFTQKPNTTISTLMGLKITNITTSAELYNNFSLTSKFIFMYLGFMLLFLLVKVVFLPKIKQ